MKQISDKNPQLETLSSCLTTCYLVSLVSSWEPKLPVVEKLTNTLKPGKWSKKIGSQRQKLYDELKTPGEINTFNIVVVDTLPSVSETSIIFLK